MTRVLTVSTIFPGRATAGQGVFIKERQKHLPERFDVEVVRARPWFPLAGALLPHLAGDVPEREIVDGLTVHDMRFFYVPRFTKGRDGLRLARALDRWITRHGESVDVLDAHFAFPTGAGVVQTARRRGLPSVITLRGTIASYRDQARRARIRDALRGASAVISVSESLCDIAREIAGDIAVDVIPNGVDTTRFRAGDVLAARQAVGVVDRGPILCSVGGLVPRKGVQRVLEVLPAVRRHHPDLLYLVVGGGGVEGDFEATLRRQVTELGLEANVRFTGAVDHDGLPDHYRASDLFCLATANEGWANAIQESLACGTPVVTTDVGGNREVVGDAAHGDCISFGDSAALEAAILDHLDNPRDRSAVAEWGGRRSWRDVGAEVAGVYDRVLGAS